MIALCAIFPPTLLQFHYGSHYSSLASVLFFLIRMRPFTDYALDRQGGHFDHADRIFTSIQRTYTNITTSMTDVKELLPEFYYKPLATKKDLSTPGSGN